METSSLLVVSLYPLTLLLVGVFYDLLHVDFFLFRLHDMGVGFVLSAHYQVNLFGRFPLSKHNLLTGIFLFREEVL